MGIKKKLINIYLSNSVDKINIIKNKYKNNINKKAKYYVICSRKKRGFFSLLLFVLNHIQFAKKNKLIPVIDMKHHPTLYNERKVLFGTQNSWEYYFHKINKINIDQVYEGKNYFICKDKNILTKNNKFNSILTNTYKKFIKINTGIIKKYFLYKKKIFKNKEKFLGVHFRGTDMKYSTNHPFPLTKKQINKQIPYLMKKYKLKKIFLVTEDSKNFDFFINNFKNYEVFHTKNYRTSKTRAFDRNYRKNHKYKMGEEALINALLLSNCKVLLSSQTGISDFAKFKNPGLKYIKINNGNNSNRILFSIFKYHLKDFLPKFLGGFSV